MVTNKQAVDIFLGNNKLFSSRDRKKLVEILDIVDPEGFNEYSDEEVQNKLELYLVMLGERP